MFILFDTLQHYFHNFLSYFIFYYQMEIKRNLLPLLSFRLVLNKFIKSLHLSEMWFTLKIEIVNPSTLLHATNYLLYRKKIDEIFFPLGNLQILTPDAKRFYSRGGQFCYCLGKSKSLIRLLKGLNIFYLIFYIVNLPQ